MFKDVLVRKTEAMSSSDSSDSSLLPLSSQQGQQWWTGQHLGWCSGSRWGRSTTPYVEMRLPKLTLARAFPKRLGQKGSTFHESTDLILCDHHLIVVQHEGGEDAGELRGGGKCPAGSLC